MCEIKDFYAIGELLMLNLNSLLATKMGLCKKAKKEKMI